MKITPEGVKLTALSRDDLRYTAYRIASELRSGNGVAAFKMVCNFAQRVGQQRVLRLFQLVAESYKGSARFDPSDTRRRIIVAFYETSQLRNIETEYYASPNDVFVGPTLPQVKQQFARLFPNVKTPRDETFKRTFRELAPLRDWCKSKGGRPLGRKDEYKRKRRKTRSRKATF